MLTQFRVLSHVGQFENTSSPPTLRLRKYVLIYAENGRGKTTLSAIFHSLASGNAIKIRERRRLGNAEHPRVVITHDGTPPPFIFDNGIWNRTLQDLAVFDDQFVDENIYSGLSVEANHRQGLHQLVIGANGVALNRRHQELVNQIETHLAELRRREEAIPRDALGSFPVEAFCNLPQVPDVDARIEAVSNSLNAAREQTAIRTTPSFPPLNFPSFDVESISYDIGRTLATLNSATVRRVRDHFHAVGPGGESWVQDGMRRLISAESHLLCPFCEQDLDSSNLIGQYQSYFSQEYQNLKQAISSARFALEEVHSLERLPLTLVNSIRNANDLRSFWNRFLTVAPIEFDTDTFIQDWRAARTGLLALLDEKAASPLEPLVFSAELSDAVGRFRIDLQRLFELNERLSDDNARIASLKTETVGASALQLQQELDRLRACQVRHSSSISPLCDRYQAELQAKEATERLRDNTRQQIDGHRATAFPAYQSGINTYLTRFGVGFQLDNVSPVDTRGGATCNYNVVINNVSIPIAGAQQLDQPCFRNTLSAGDRNALALSFFFASLDSDPSLSSKIVVLDDPLSSLDEHRWFSTVQETRTLADRVAQIILLSHDKSFLGRVWEGIGRDPSVCTPLKIQRSGSASVIEEWDVGTDSITEHDRNHRLLREYARNGPANDSRKVAAALRPFLEGFVRVAFPEHCPPQPRAFANFVAACRQRLGAADQILSQADYNELSELVEYGNLFHHETNAAFDETLSINDGQLRVFVERALAYARG